MSTAPASTACLEGLLVVELGDHVAAGACGSLLARLGADVTFVERAAGDTHHKWANRPVMAAGKRSLVADRGGANPLLARLVDRADIVLLSSDLDAFDLELWRQGGRADQIVCDFTAFGHQGPLAGLPGDDVLVQALCGVLDTTGLPDGPPVITGAPLISMEAGVYGASAVLAALHAARQGSGGQKIDMALYDVGVNALLTFMPLHQIGRKAQRGGNRHPTLSPWNSYPSRGGDWVLICAPTDQQWQRLCEVMGRPELASAPRFATTTARFDNREAIDREIAAWTRSLDAREIVEQACASSLPASTIEMLTSLHDEANIVHRAMSRTARDPVSGEAVRLPGSPVREAGRAPAAGPEIPTPDGDRAWLAARPGRPAAAPRRPAAAPATALGHLRIIEIGMNTVGPLAGRQLGALGADVIKIEAPSGDTNRYNTPLREDGLSYVFALSNTDKRSLVLNLRDADDRERLLDLIGTADAVIENLRPGALDKLGLGGADVLARHPHIVYCSVNGFGLDSAYPGRPALDTVIQAMSGVMDTNRVDGLPLKSGLSVSDQLGGQFGLLAVLAALYRRGKDGAGVHLDLAMQDCSAWSAAMRWNGGESPYDHYSVAGVADGHVVAPAGCDLAGLSALTRAGAVARLEKQGVRAAPVLSLDEVLTHPQIAARGLLCEAVIPDGAPFTVLGCPMRLLGTPPLVSRTLGRLDHVDAPLAAELSRLAAASRSGAAPRRRIRA